MSEQVKTINAKHLLPIECHYANIRESLHRYSALTSLMYAMSGGYPQFGRTQAREKLGSVLAITFPLVA